MKKIITGFVMFIFTMCTFNVCACENKDELVANHYDYLHDIYPDFVIDAMSCDEIEYAIDNNYVLVSSDTEIEYDETRAYDSHATASKKVELHEYAGSYSNRVNLSNIWYTIPTVRSYDILALRFQGPSYATSATSSYFQYSTSTYSSRMDYTSSSNNVTSATNGIGFVYKLPTDTDLNGMYFFMTTLTSGSGTIAGTYQHAKSYVTKANAMNYGFSSIGLGGVVYHASSTTRSKYDAMGGVSVSV